MLGELGGHVDISTSPPSSCNHEYHAGTLHPEPFVNYISEGSITILICKFEVAVEASTDTPKVALELESSVRLENPFRRPICGGCLSP